MTNQEPKRNHTPPPPPTSAFECLKKGIKPTKNPNAITLKLKK